MVVGLSVYSISLAADAEFNSSPVPDVLIVGVTQCLDVRFSMDLEDLKTRRLLQVAFGSTDEF